MRRTTGMMGHNVLERNVVEADHDDMTVSAQSAWLLWVIVVITVSVLCLVVYKHADAADGVVEFNLAQLLAGGITVTDAPGFPATLDVAGHYVLMSDLALPDVNTHGIAVAAADVTIDLNGFSISGPVICGGKSVTCKPAGTGSGIVVLPGVERTTIRNGVVRGMGRHGIVVGVRSSVEDVTVTHNRLVGIKAGDFAMLKGSTANANGENGIMVGAFSVVQDNTVKHNRNNGMSVGRESTVTHSIAVGNWRDGILAATKSELAFNTSSRNGHDGIDVGRNSIASRNLLTRNGNHGIRAGAGSTLINNRARYNGDDGINAILGTTLTGNMLKSNDLNKYFLAVREASS